ncbi:polysaccharide deacetylase family protein, partial [candidate division WWE3 bacterium]|nr:polysaccharide deacetylase family protein [candidate division WWE3 bacterium]
IKKTSTFILTLLTVCSIGFYLYYISPFGEPNPSNPQAEEEPTPTPTASTSQFVDVGNFEGSDLQTLLDKRYVQVAGEVDPLWSSEKSDYSTTSEIIALLSSTYIGTVDATQYYTKIEVNSLLATLAASDHTHLDDFYSRIAIDTLLDEKSDSSHNHNDLYYTQSQITGLLSDKSDSDHTHDGRYYTESEIDALLSLKADTTHNHDSSYYTQSQVDTSLAETLAQASYNKLLPIQNNFSRVDQMESGWTNFYGNGTISFDTSDYISGAGSLKIVTSSNASNSGARKYVTPDEDWSGKAIKIHVKASDWSQIQEVRILISTSGQFVSHFYTNLNPVLTYPENHDNEWLELVMPTSSFLEVNSPDWSTVNQLIVRAIGVNGQTPTVWFDEYALVDNPSGAMLSVTFDDGHSSDYTLAREVMDTYGYKGSLFIIPDLIGTSGRMTQSQVDTMHTLGWDISGHGDTDLTSLSLSAAEDDLINTKEYLISNGYRGGDLYAYPNGAHNEAIRNLTQKYFGLSRTIANFNQPITYMSPMMLHSRVVHDYDSTVTINGWIDDAVANNEWLILTFHRIVSGTPTSSIEYQQSDFQTVIDYANSVGIPVMPMTQAIRTFSKY